MAWQEWLRDAVLADLPTDRRWSYLSFALALSVALMSFQFVSPVKIAIFVDVVGTSSEPIAKSLVLVVLLPLLVCYSVLVSLLSRRALVLIVCGFYMLVFLAIAVFVMLAHGKPPAWVAWVLYFAAETRAVIVMPMIWSVVADVSTAELSRKAYGMLFFGIQVGGILGSFCAMKVSSLGGEVGLLLLTTASFAVIGGFTVLGCEMVAEGSNEERLPITASATVEANEADDASQASKKSAGEVASEAFRSGFDGLWLLISRPYAMMVFWISYAYLVPRTMLDYEQTVLANQAFSSREELVVYFGRISMLTNILTAAVALFGTRQIIQFFGVARMLMLLPFVMLICIGALSAHYDITMASTTVVFASTVAYGLNQPCKEMLIVRTSRDIKYKAKAWSEMYGNQLMKMLGAQVNLWVNNDQVSCRPNCFHPFPTMSIVLGWVVVWWVVAEKAGSTYTKLDSEDKIVS